jgi:hypothetical protein
MRKTKLISLLSSICALAVELPAQSAPYPLLQNAILSGSGNTINATQVPVVTAAGTTVYVNFSLQFNADATGNITVASNSLAVTLAPALISSSFRAGTYVSGSNTLSGTGSIVVAGPAVTDGGATIWTDTTPTGANSCTYPGNSTWYVGPLANSPYAARLKKAGLTSTAFSYGVIGSQNCSYGSNWHSDSLIGLTQVGNTLTIVDFSDVNNNDYALPVDQITYTLKP